MGSNGKTLVIIPAYNEEESIVSTVDELTATIPGIFYIIVNDGSSDRTAELCLEHGYRFINHPVNLGLTGAFETGMKYAARHGFDRAIQFDADGQHMPDCIGLLERKMDETGADIVIGSRFVSEKKPQSMRMIGSNLISAIIRVTTGTCINDPTSGMRLYNRRIIEEFDHRGDLSPEPDTMAFLIKRKNAKVVECQVKMRERMAGESYLTFSKSIAYMVNAFTSILFAQWFRR